MESKLCSDKTDEVNVGNICGAHGSETDDNTSEDETCMKTKATRKGKKTGALCQTASAPPQKRSKPYYS